VNVFLRCHHAIAGDFNCNLNNNDAVAKRVTSFIDDWSLIRCDELFPKPIPFTYVNSALNQHSYIDYIAVSSDIIVNKFSILDPDINFSDHLPLYVSLEFGVKDKVKTNVRYPRREKP